MSFLTRTKKKQNKERVFLIVHQCVFVIKWKMCRQTCLNYQFILLKESYLIFWWDSFNSCVAKKSITSLYYFQWKFMSGFTNKYQTMKQLFNITSVCKVSIIWYVFYPSTIPIVCLYLIVVLSVYPWTFLHAKCM